jgi:hypothetical protein
MLLTLNSTSSQAAAPFCLGYAFRKGDVPAGRTLISNIATLQVTPKNYWPDGSLKFAIVAGTAPLTANTPLTASLSIGAAAASSPLATSNLRATGIAATVSCGAFGTATWAAADWDAPFQAWVAGPQMSSWIYRKGVGTDAHLVAWLEVRLFANGAVEVLPWIENGYLRVAGPTNKAATFSFSLGGTQRFSAAIDLKHHQRTPLIDGSALSYWLGAEPFVTPRHDVEYLQSTGLVPAYYAQVDRAATVVSQLASTFKPLQQSNFNFDGDSMPSSGYQEPIGLLPQHDVLYLTTTASTAYGAVIRNGFSAGRYPIHYRDESTNRPLRISQYPNLVISDGSSFKDNGSSTKSTVTPAVSGGAPPTWDVAHSPSVGFMAYLITGRWYFMEEVQFAATANYLGNGDNAALRNGSLGLVQTAVQAWQTRSCAWNWRTLVQALSVTPDADSLLRSEFITCVNNNIDHFHGRYVAKPNNPFGWILPGETYDGNIRFGAPWQQDFVTAAFGYALAMDLPIPADYSVKLASFFAWKAKSVISRLGAASDFWYINAAPYNMVISPSAAPDYVLGTGPWYASDAEVYAGTFATKPAWFGNQEGTLAGEIMPGERAMWGNLMPALSYAVQHSVPGASAAYSRLVAASNWSALRSAFNRNPVWGVRPLSGKPLWVLEGAVNQWIEIPGTAGAGGAAVDAYSGFAWNDAASEIIIAAAGGHNDSSDNRVVSIRLAEDTPVWRTRMQASSNVTRDVAYYADGKPASRHLYSTIHHIPQLDRVMLFGVRFPYGSAVTFSKVDGFNLNTNTWDPAGTWPDLPSGAGYGACVIRATGEVWTNGLHMWSPTSNQWTNPLTHRTADFVRWPIAHDAKRNQLFTLEWADGEGYGTAVINATRIALSGMVQKTVSFKPSSALDQFVVDAPTYAAMDYDPVNDQFLYYCGQGSGAGRIYVVKPNDTDSWEMTFLQLAAVSAMPPATRDSGVQNRFRYVSALKGFILLANASSNLYFIRTS